MLVNLEFKIEESDIDSLAQVASVASNDAFDFLSPEEIELQRRLLNDPSYDMGGNLKMESIYGVYWIVRDEKREIMC